MDAESPRTPRGEGPGGAVAKMGGASRRQRSHGAGVDGRVGMDGGGEVSLDDLGVLVALDGWEAEAGKHGAGPAMMGDDESRIGRPGSGSGHGSRRRGVDPLRTGLRAVDAAVRESGGRVPSVGEAVRPV